MIDLARNKDVSGVKPSMSKRVDVETRVRELASKHPGWTPSQIAIYLQGENIKITSDEVRRILRGSRAGSSARTRSATPTTRPASSLPIGTIFGLIFFIIQTAVSYVDPNNYYLYAEIALAVIAVGLIVCGALASRIGALAANAGALASLVFGIVSFLLLVVSYNFFPSIYSKLRYDIYPTARDFIPNGLVLYVAFLIVSILAGFVLGWIGGKLFGRRKRRVAFQ